MTRPMRVDRSGGNLPVAAVNLFPIEAEKDACREQRKHRERSQSAQVIDIATKKTHVTPKVLSAEELGIEPPAIRWRFAADGSKIYERIRSVRDEPAGQS